MESKLDRIMAEVVCLLACKWKCVVIDGCPHRDKIASILAEPDVIEVDGVEWEKGAFPLTATVGDHTCSLYQGSSEIGDPLYHYSIGRHGFLIRSAYLLTGSGLNVALSAATAAIKEGKDHA